MPPPVADDGHKRRARRRLIGAVALTIVAVIILPLVLENEPPPAGPLEVRMPPAANDLPTPQNTVEFAPPPANTQVEPGRAESAPSGNEPLPRPAAPPQPVSAPAASVEQASNAAQSPVLYTVQVGVFVDKANVERLQSRISELGLKSFTDEVGDSTRVRVGSYPNKTDADAVLAKLAAMGIAAKVVEK